MVKFAPATMFFENRFIKYFNIWLLAIRPRTLVLALSSILMGTFLASTQGDVNWSIAFLCILTATLLQVLSNLANDYGDSIHGADHEGRIGPARTVQLGLLSSAEIKKAIYLCAILAIASGGILLIISIGFEGLMVLILFTLLGLAAIWAAYYYTAGNIAYGYTGFGDLFVFIFFGFVGVVGSYFLQTLNFKPSILLPATSCGLLAVAVLNINNIRDIVSDRIAGKRTIPVRLGLRRARIYHWLLLMGAQVAVTIYVSLNFINFWQLLFLITLPLLIRIGLKVSRQPPHQLDPLLKTMSLSAFAFSLAFGVGQVLAFN